MQTRICSHVIDKGFIDYYSSTSFNVYPWYLLVAMQANQYESIKELEDSTDTRTIGSTRVATQLQYCEWHLRNGRNGIDQVNHKPSFSLFYKNRCSAASSTVVLYSELSAFSLHRFRLFTLHYTFGHDNHVICLIS